MLLDPLPLCRCSCGALATVHCCAACHGQPHPPHATRIRQGLARARAKGIRLGRPLTIPAARLAAIKAALAGGMSKAQACTVFGVKRTTLYDALAREG